MLRPKIAKVVPAPPPAKRAHLSPRQPKRPASRPQKSKPPRKKGKRKGKGKSKNAWAASHNGKPICRRFQTGTCKSDNCQFAHVCAIKGCQQTHPASTHRTAHETVRRKPRQLPRTVPQKRRPHSLCPLPQDLLLVHLVDLLHACESSKLEDRSSVRWSKLEPGVFLARRCQGQQANAARPAYAQKQLEPCVIQNVVLRIGVQVKSFEACRPCWSAAAEIGAWTPAKTSSRSAPRVLCNVPASEGACWHDAPEVLGNGGWCVCTERCVEGRVRVL